VPAVPLDQQVGDIWRHVLAGLLHGMPT
jgi:hypothetical protein